MDGQENSGYDRSFANRKYYEQNKLKSHKYSLLHNIKTKGRVPFLQSVKLYDMTNHLTGGPPLPLLPTSARALD